MFHRAFSFARIASCARACVSGVVGSIDHSKWITVSRLRARNRGGSEVLSTSLNPSCELSHDKVVIISVGGLREVIAGSQDQTPSEVLIDDNQMVKTTNRGVFRRYVAYFKHQFHSPRSTNCANGGFAGSRDN